MAFVDDREDIYSFALTAVSKLLKKNNIDPASIGRLEVGTETLLDKSKSVKSVLMQLFGDNADIEGVDTINACYGGTNALFNAINWVESSSWDGRNAIVVAGDIAIYSKGAARPTGGAGVVALLIGPDAPLVFDPVHGSYMQHAYDFYKPDLTSEYPVVDGHFSLTCYTRALDQAYKSYNKKAEKRHLFTASEEKQGIKRFDYSVFHVPTCKLVSKCYGRLHYNDYLENPAAFADAEIPAEVKSVDYEASLTDKVVEKTFLNIAKDASKTRLAPSLIGPTNTGNMYTASVYSSLASLLTFVPADELAGKRVSLFSYGSGLASSFYSLVIKGDIAPLVKNLEFKKLLDDRTTVTPTEYEAALALREKAHLQKSFKPTGSVDALREGTYYLTEVDDKFRRSYAVKN
ncbi:hydroxymethylglutaryl-CoA synthase [Sugiyamaella lignohabitans]|uniref:Hydroxymethylglutaryl-CoA synthase n=1 Tax=Sugiyamaella lignohabitans TaxID=796027 RepID=A0A167CLP5_9ASCO|nr:hydroxymethylglutaryl-CoA synthase [Sugiyamaella lignohabitans]ANB11863.1 hydroxymethylglutaryl-CoA synthase [Sugiyamaella lignohabitans]